jgi:hypothetical protein
MVIVIAIYRNEVNLKRNKTTHENFKYATGDLKIEKNVFLKIYT